MKKILMFFVAILCTGIAFAQTTYRYQFNNKLHEQFFKGPDLKLLCPGNGYWWKNISGSVSKNVYMFNKDCGLLYDDSVKNLLAGGSYTIEIIFMLDTIQGYKKLVDFDSLGVDAGFYNQNGKLVLYPSFTSVDSFVGAGTYSFVALTRDGSSKAMWVYHNNKVAGMHTDNTDLYIPGSNKKLIFFNDDNGTSGEHSSGAVAIIYISDFVMDSTTIKSHYTNIGKYAGIDGTDAVEKQISVYPNPAAANVHITATQPYDFSLCDVTGKVLINGTVKQGENVVSIDKLSAGMYLLHTMDKDGTQQGVYKLIKE